MFGWGRRRERLLREFEEHMALAAEENVAAGMTPEAARRAARKSFGSTLAAAERSREVWGWSWLGRTPVEEGLREGGRSSSGRGLRRSGAGLVAVELAVTVVLLVSAGMVGGFAAVALVLGTVGLYGVIAYSVAQRRREIGVRVALGAPRGTLYRMVMEESARLSLAGVLLTASLAASFVPARRAAQVDPMEALRAE